MAIATRSEAPIEGPVEVHSSTPPAVSRTSRVLAGIVVALSLIAIVGGVAARFAKESEGARSRAAGLRERREAANLPPEVAVTLPEAFSYMPHFSITGMLDPVQEAQLGFNAGGRVASIEVTLGQQVRAGQVLATLDRRSIAAQSALVSASVDAGNANLAMAQDRLRRAEALHGRGATSDAELEAARQGVALATAQLGQAQAQTRVVSSDGSNHTIRAPFDGIITRVPDGVGNVVGPGTVLFRLEDMSKLVMHTGITERALDRIAIGDRVPLERFPEVQGTVRAFVRSLDPITRRAPVEVEFDNANGRLVGHQLLKGQIVCDRPIPSLRIPGTAVRSDQTVLVVDGEGHIQSRPVEAIVEADGFGVVLFGLTPADRVVVRPTPDLAPGVEVRIAAPARPAAAPSAGNAR